MLSTVLRGIAAAQQLPMQLQCSVSGNLICDWGVCLERLEWLLAWMAASCCGPVLELHGGRHSLLERLGRVSLPAWQD